MAYADRCFIAVFAGIVACGFGSLAWYSAQRRVRIHRWPHWGQVLGSAACFLPMMFIFSDARMKAAIAALLVVETVGFAWFMRRNLEYWTITDVPEEHMELVIEKALAQAGIQPERGLTGLKLTSHVTLRISAGTNLGMRSCSLMWEPVGSWKQVPEFVERLEEGVSKVVLPPRTSSTIVYSSICGAAILIGAIGVLVVK